MSNNTTAEKPKSEWSKRECGRLWVSEGKINVWLNGPDKTIIKPGHVYNGLYINKITSITKQSTI